MPPTQGETKNKCECEGLGRLSSFGICVKECTFQCMSRCIRTEKATCAVRETQ